MAASVLSPDGPMARLLHPRSCVVDCLAPALGSPGGFAADQRAQVSCEGTQLPVDPIESTVDRIESTVDPIEPAVDAVEPLVVGGQPVVDGLEARL